MGLLPIINCTAGILLLVLTSKSRHGLSAFITRLAELAAVEFPHSAPRIGLNSKWNGLRKLYTIYGLSVPMIFSYMMFIYVRYYTDMDQPLFAGLAILSTPLNAWSHIISPVYACFIFVFAFFAEFLTGIFREYAKNLAGCVQSSSDEEGAWLPGNSANPVTTASKKVVALTY